MNNLQLEHLKVIRVALSTQPISQAILEAIAAVDNELAAKYNIKAEWVVLPKKPYQRQESGEYQFKEIWSGQN